jgi:hypothetical protein
VSGFFAPPAPTSMQPQAVTPTAGFALQNGTPNILQWNVPNDGKNHRFQVFGEKIVTALETGGQINVTFTTPDGGGQSVSIVGGGLAAGHNMTSYRCEQVQAGSVVTVVQNTALTAGASILYAELWGV